MATHLMSRPGSQPTAVVTFMLPATRDRRIFLSRGLIYLTGTTSSKDLGTVLPLQPQLGGGLDCFVAIVNAQGTFTYSSYLGGKGREICSALAVDATGITVVGSTESSDLPTLRPVQASLAGPSDGFIAKLAIDGSRYLYSTYLGGSDSDILNNVIS